jgi:hypothetical protein
MAHKPTAAGVDRKVIEKDASAASIARISASVSGMDACFSFTIPVM